MRWDGDKVRGVRMELRDGTIKSAGGIDDVKYTLSSYTFQEGETLQSLSFSSSGYGYGSLRRMEFTTSLGATFNAGTSRHRPTSSALRYQALNSLDLTCGDAFPV